jgi:hypothetical protein
MSTETEGHLEVQLAKTKKDVPYTVTRLTRQQAGQLAVCLMHGASGGKDSGHLPSTAEACVMAGFPCLRFTCRGGNLQHRIAVCKARACWNEA